MGFPTVRIIRQRLRLVKTNTSRAQLALGFAALLALSGCSTVEVDYTIGARVSGLVGTGLMLQVNQGEAINVISNGLATFPTRLPAGSTYQITVLHQPARPDQACAVENGSGTLGSSGGTMDVLVNCGTSTPLGGPPGTLPGGTTPPGGVSAYTIGGAVSGLIGSGLVLQDNGGDSLSVTADGSFIFSNPLAAGTTYAVTIAAQPTNPSQICSVTNAAGAVGAANVTSVAVSCTTDSYSIGGATMGLVGSGLVLSDNATDNLSVSTNGPFTFAATIASGGTYHVTVAAQPTNPTQTCTIANGTGTVGAGNVTGVQVTCVSSTFTVGGNVSGLLGSGLKLRNNGAVTLSVFSNGSFTFPVPVASGGAYNVSVATQPSTPNQFCSVTNGVGTVTSLNVNTVSVVCRSTGRVLYVANNSNDVSVFRIDPTSGVPTPVAGSPFAAGTGPTSIAVTPNAHFAYVTNGMDGTISAYTVDPVTSALTAVSGSPYLSGGNPVSVTVDPSGRFVYATNYNDDDVSAFTINPTTGALTAVAGSPFPTDANPQFVMVNPSGRFVYVLDYLSRDISVYSIDATTGILTALSGSPFFGVTGSGPFYMAITPGGQFAYVANNDGSQHVSGFTLDPVSGAPVASLLNSPYFGGISEPWAISIDPTGRYAYVDDKASDTVVGFTINAVTGDLTVMPASPFPTHVNPRAVAVDPSGQFAYVANADTSDISVYTIDATSGALTVVAGGPFLTDNGPVSIAISQ